MACKSHQHFAALWLSAPSTQSYHMSTNDHGYRFHPGEASVFVEIYLPKKARFQGVLYDTLTRGFEPETVRRHLDENEERVRRLMQGYYFVEYSREVVESMGDIMGGYSLYEVDGVFLNNKDRSVIEERTQVIRIMFRPSPMPVDLDPDLKKQIIREYLRFTGDREDFEEHLGKRLELQKNQQLVDLVAMLRQWECQVAHFVFGYIVDSLCEQIRMYKEKSDIPEEAEIWVTSFWNLVINRIAKPES